MPLGVAFALSLLGNAVAAVLVVRSVEVAPAEPDPVDVEVVLEPAPRPRDLVAAVAPDPAVPAPAPLPEPAPTPAVVLERAPEPVPVPERAPEPEPETEPEPEPEPEVAQPIPLPELPEVAPQPTAVSQEEYNDQDTPDSQFVAERANRVDRDTQARNATAEAPTPEREVARAEPDRGAGEASEQRDTLDARHGNPDATQLVAIAEPRTPSPQPPRPPARPPQPAVDPEPTPPPVPVPDPGEGRAQAPPPTLDPMRALREAMRPVDAGEGYAAAVAAPSHAAYAEIFGARDGLDGDRLAQERLAGSIAGDHEGRWERTRGALENYDALIELGDQTAIGTRADPAAAWIHAAHNRIHPVYSEWLLRLDFTEGPAGELSDPNLRVVIEFSVLPDGTVDQVRIGRSSGRTAFDAEAIDLVGRLSPYPAPPASILSSDGRVYARWTFHRDQRMCATAGASVHILDRAGAAQ